MTNIQKNKKVTYGGREFGKKGFGREEGEWKWEEGWK